MKPLYYLKGSETTRNDHGEAGGVPHAGGGVSGGTRSGGGVTEVGARTVVCFVYETAER